MLSCHIFLDFYTKKHPAASKTLYNLESNGML